MYKIEALAVTGALCAIAAIVLYPVTVSAPGPTRIGRCQTNLKQVGLGFTQYLQDFDSHYPPVKVSSRPSKDRAFGWADALYPYLKSTQITHCPSAPARATSANPIAAGYTDYWYNSNLSGIDEGKLSSVAQTITIGDGNDGTDLNDARYAISALPPAWIKHLKSPLYRHIRENKGLVFKWQEKGLANYLFADGHVKALSTDEIKPTMEQGSPTLALK